MKKGLAVLVVLALGAGAYWYFSERDAAAKPSYRTAKIDRGAITVAITATGTLQAVTTVQVGTQISGVVEKLFVDFNDRVEAGQVVAQLDPDLLEVRLTQDKAALARVEANLVRLQVDLSDALRKLERQKELFAQKVASQNDLDTAQLAVDTAKAQIEVSKAELAQSRAAVSSSEINLRNATITSPISGIVISRSVDVGQTVAASLSAPTLFTIANDLSKMWVLANVDEADVGRVVMGQEATFSVDSFPDREFRAKVRQVRLQPTTVQNVVMYTVVLDVDNPEGILLPGLTANLSILIDRVESALRIPNAALRFQPFSMGAEAAAPPPERREGAAGRAPREREKKGPGNGQSDAIVSTQGKPGRVYRMMGGELRAVEIRMGRTDGAFTELLGGELKEGDEIVVGSQASDRPTSNPAARSPWGGGRR